MTATNEVRPLHELLALALPQYKREAQTADEQARKDGRPFMCMVVCDLHIQRVYSEDETDVLLAAINEWIDGRITLAVYLDSQGRPTHRLARLRFYMNKLAELKREGLS